MRTFVRGSLLCCLFAVIAACTSQTYDGDDPLPTEPDAELVTEAKDGCESVCTLGRTQCESSMAARVCERDGNGCPSWTSVPCVQGAECKDDVPKCLGNCESECPAEGARQCASDSSAGVLVCTRLPSGCLSWQPADDCTAGTSCKDGACVAGCKDDVGWDATTIDRTRCGALGKASQRCVLDGACHRWKTEKVVPQECTGSGPYACSGLSAKKSCKLSVVGACLGHEISVTACAPGTICVGSGSCQVVCPPSDGCDAAKLGTTRCKPATTTTRQTCEKDASGCYRWIDRATCINGTVCSAGTCKCMGCASGGACAAGTSKTACGTGGGACRDCNAYCEGFGKTATGCVNGGCTCSAAF